MACRVPGRGTSVRVPGGAGPLVTAWPADHAIVDGARLALLNPSASLGADGSLAQRHPRASCAAASHPQQTTLVAPRAAYSGFASPPRGALGEQGGGEAGVGDRVVGAGPDQPVVLVEAVGGVLGKSEREQQQRLDRGLVEEG